MAGRGIFPAMVDKMSGGPPDFLKINGPQFLKKNKFYKKDKIDI